ncbi:MerR family transcriptional regulator [Flavobacterium aquariorum]|uniref:MerR family transcriptional regulator n=1 Tax=Flavobacterium aquariorum TaxID=2217670 RepID=A0A2W7TS37_9FLAO|nr:MerR family transcriptional regulator [Flavobacterium aquariorum]PZX92868.1 MerR family transcriptional regulator [Flavobacterium aquariorum]
MNNIKNTFSIKDLENLSGIKAHTIRIWEKRYNVLQPMRTDTNIRLYSLSSLQKLLNITLLHDYGYKISKISTFTDEKISEMIRDVISNKNVKNHAVNAFKMAMMNFDQELFSNTYNWLQEEKSFKEIFHQVFIPLMEEIGLLWQSDTITPAHEHFISCLILKKILVNIEKVEATMSISSNKVYVLSLPLNEIHELGLMYLHYEIVSKGYKVVYLGESMPIANLKDLKKHYNLIVFLSYFTIQPDRDSVNDYVNSMGKELLGDGSQIWLIGKMTQYIDQALIPVDVKVFNSISDLVEKI